MEQSSEPGCSTAGTLTSSLVRWPRPVYGRSRQEATARRTRHSAPVEWRSPPIEGVYIGPGPRVTVAQASVACTEALGTAEVKDQHLGVDYTHCS